MTQQHPRRLALVLAAAVAAGCARHSGDLAGVVVGSLPIFETRIDVPTGSSAHSDYYVADFNGDGKLDMAVISLTGELRVLIGSGTSFAIGQELQIGGLPSWMAGGDFDGDGDQDLVVVRSVGNTTDIWLNDGNGTFAQAGTLQVGADALAVAVGDFDDDGDLDVAVSRPGAPEIVIGFGDGAGGFVGQQQITLPGGGVAFGLTAGDVTGDNRDDLIVSDTGQSRVLIFSGSAPTDFGTNYLELSVPGTPGAVALGDLSGDQVPDLVVSAFNANKYVVITSFGIEGQLPGGGGGGQVGFYSSFDIPVPARPSLATIADVTGDGVNDLVACLAFTASLFVWEQPQGKSESNTFVLDTTGYPLRPFAGDFDQNGKNDVTALAGNGSLVNLWLSRNSGALLGARSYDSGLPGASWMDGGDFDGDGDAELIVGSDSGTQLSILGALAGGKLAPEFTIDVGLPIHQLEVGDLDLDGRPDVVVGVPGGLRILRNQSTPGGYSFSMLPGSVGTIASGSYPFGITIGDFNRDGRQDIAFCDFVGGALHIVPGTATPFVFGAEIVIGLGGGPVDVAAADFTGDGLLDFAVSRQNLSDIVVLRNLGNNAYTEFLTVPVGASPNYLVTADFNRDGRADLVVSNADSGTVSVLFGTPQGFSGQSFAAGAAPTALLARDLTNDGAPDILVASLQSGDFRVLVGDGRGGFPLLPRFPGTLGASDAVLQDMTGDGLPDLMISSLVTNRVSLVRRVGD